jgi:NAD(P)-dependent dehydrogenase (short-subunit alcohol dehydrogenase family)
MKMIKSELFDLSGKVALVTAGGHGLGREYCIAMAKFGADVACNDIDMKLAQETVELVKKFGHRAIAIKADVSKVVEIECMVNQTVSEFGTIDILFCNAGVVNPIVPFHELSIEDWDRVIALNLRGTFLCMRAVLPIMIKQKKGSIISTASLAGLMCGITPHSAPYGASKAGVIGLTKHAAVTYAKDGIRINAIAPGLHDTNPVGLNLTLEQSEELKKTISPSIPMGRFAEPNEIQALAVYLASDASSYVTGQVFVQDGGFSA